LAWAALLGLGMCLAIFDWDFLTGVSPFWSHRHDDRAQALIGWFAYVNDSWRYPLLWTKLLRYPVGVSIVFTDSIPLAALAAKPLRGLLPSGFHYFGLWMGLCFVLQSATAWLALRAWGVSSYVARTAGCLMALSMPMWLVRGFHVSLCSHFLLLAGLWLYARRNIGGERDSRAWHWWLLLVLALLVHVYLFAMVTALWLASAASSRPAHGGSSAHSSC
jgi:hypothetical protein